MHRLDAKLKTLKENSPEFSARETELTLTYEQVAINFADLHDTPGRMKAKGCINEVLQWRGARTFFYFRVKRRLLEEYLKREIFKANPEVAEKRAAEMIQEWAKADGDKEFIAWIEKEEEEIKKKLKEVKESFVKDQAVKMAQEAPDAAVEGLVQVLNGLPEQQRLALLQKLKGIK
jgi:acetyl-CoA carboxylase/biotin carboxylase 1